MLIPGLGSLISRGVVDQLHRERRLIFSIVTKMYFHNSLTTSKQTDGIKEAVLPNVIFTASAVVFTMFGEL